MRTCSRSKITKWSTFDNKSSLLGKTFENSEMQQAFEWKTFPKEHGTEAEVLSSNYSRKLPLEKIVEKAEKESFEHIRTTGGKTDTHTQRENFSRISKVSL